MYVSLAFARADAHTETLLMRETSDDRAKDKFEDLHRSVTVSSMCAASMLVCIRLIHAAGLR